MLSSASFGTGSLLFPKVDFKITENNGKFKIKTLFFLSNYNYPAGFTDSEIVLAYYYLVSQNLKGLPSFTPHLITKTMPSVDRAKDTRPPYCYTPLLFMYKPTALCLLDYCC